MCKIEPDLQPSCFVLTRNNSCDVVEEEEGVFDGMLTILSEEDSSVALDVVLRFLRLSESHEFVRSASNEMLTFYCRVLLSLARLCCNKPGMNAVGHECEAMLTTRELSVYNTLKAICLTDTADQDSTIIVKEAYLTIALKMFHKLATSNQS